MQANQYRRCFFGSGGVTEIVGSQNITGKFGFTLATLPKKIRIELIRCFFARDP